MRGTDSYYEDEDFEFTGTEGLTYESFLQRIRRIAFQQERSRDSAWMADLAALHLSGDALRWYETLDGNVQKDWDLLRMAVVQQFGEPRPAIESPSGDLAVKPKKKEDPKPAPDPLLPARVEIANWTSPTLASGLKLPKSESAWMDEARRRKAKFKDDETIVHWRLVERGEPIPNNAIPTGNENGTKIFSIRVWQDGGLTIGKQAWGGLFWSHIRAFVPWYGKELPWEGPFEILVGDPKSVRWVSPRDSAPFHAVEGGFEKSRPDALLIAQFNHIGLLEPRKVFSADGQ
ncbi:hypothetical protein FRB90_005427, partial [Tulasnella sp. 427]